MLRTSIHTAGCLFLMLAPSLHAQSGARVPLTTAAVAAALGQNGVPIKQTEVEVPASLSSVTTDPQLYVVGAEVGADGRMRVRLACRKAGECQPFLATVRLPSAAEALTDLASLQGSLQTAKSTRPVQSDRILAGQHATMLLESSRMRITLPVLVIDSGATGTEVRVSSLDRKQIFKAVVADPATVRASLP